MTIHSDTSKLKGYQAGNFPSLGNPERFISKELDKIALALQNVITVMQLLEKRMNDDGLA